MNEQQQMTAALRETFDAVAAGYDNAALRFFPDSSRHLADLLGLRGSEHVLDVACGTGHASLAVAKKLPQGRVTGVDLSPGMLARARKKAAAAGIRNAEFHEGDMTRLGFPEASFDAAICAFGIFFVKDMEAQLSHIASKVRPGGSVAITSFQDGYFQPLRDMLFGRLSAYGVPDQPQAWKRTASDEGCRRLFGAAGLANIRVEQRDLGYYLSGAEEWWEIVWNAGFRRLLAGLSVPDQERFKREHLEELAGLRTEKGIRLDVTVLFTTGTKA